MNIEKTLSVQKREGYGKGPSGRLRAQKLIPGVFYTPKGENISVQAPALPLQKIYEEMGHTTVFNLEIEENGQKTAYPVLIWQVQFHPYKRAFTHIDFYGVDLDKEVTVDVPVEFVGTSRGVKLGGVLETYREMVRLTSKPLNMPQKITVDVTDMGINDTISVGDLKLPENVRAEFDQNYALVTVISKSKDDAEEEGDED
ncbi:MULTISPECIES: 50S ribosomal protein L25/general stress protein Ctc [Desulfovibrio]|uniref:Large ribosomal subunit protein bL25 n=3 Tax=Desulfovibrio TaxID=872 RepID=RL25_DESDA|nr:MULTISPECIES: 50S ribosomal protein L25/general stress protein Ctc [Desulfovibrio]B8J0S7.1 RecName: Full=Large ribosomal subunit protein bL25; AltName: Full=50S ribosomal protein L25; AltName: Full=General stress protein CTC [Desulfovibrio desulfuricans ATCC 27774]MDY0202709.1 50S ribosomal protein L25/general stress protein Ctc [Desulfovibrio desulfuricans]SFW61143.1 large subunit ribosomal protein L25 [Desulfovibrio desulfuricans]SPD36579.1 Ribosomal protein L25 [Desulfovibrio sp. G11]